MRSNILSKLIFASCVRYSDRAYYGLCVLVKDTMGNAICDTGVANSYLRHGVANKAPYLRHRAALAAQTPQIVSKLPRVCRHGVRLPLKLSLSQDGPVLEEICGILGQPINVQTVSQIIISDTVSQIRPLICDTTLRWRQTPRIVFKLPKVCRHGVRLPLKLSLSQNGPVLEKICGILGQQTSVQTASQTSPLFATPRCVRGRQLRLTPKLPRVCRHGVRLPLKLSLSQKRASTRGDMWYLGATEKSPEWLRT